MTSRLPSTLAAHVRRSLTRALRSSLPLLAACLITASASAQFNGPATSNVGPEVNRPAQVTTDRSLLFPSGHDQVLAAGDGIEIQLFGQPEYAPKGRIGIDGTVPLPLIGPVKLAGLSVTQAEVLIEQDLQQAGMYRNPQIILTVTEGPNASVTFIGELHGVVPVVGSRRLLDAISSAGGLPASASHVITINRPGVPRPIVVDLGSDPMRSEFANIPVFAGDTIVVARIGVVYMVGQFKSPGVISLTPYAPLTLMQATAMTGGVAFDGKLGDVRIIRTIGDRRTVVKLDANAVFYGKAPDPILQPNDIVFVPTSQLKVLIEQGGISTLFSAASLAITSIAIARQ